MKISCIVGRCDSLRTGYGLAGYEQELQKQDMLGQDDCRESTELTGDLVWTHDNDLSPVGRLVRNINVGSVSGESNEVYYNIPPLGSYACRRDECCVWRYIAGDMKRLFRGPSSRCTTRRHPPRLPRCCRLVNTHGPIRRRGRLHRPGARGDDASFQHRPRRDREPDEDMVQEVRALWHHSGRPHPDGRHGCECRLSAASLRC